VFEGASRMLELRPRFRQIDELGTRLAAARPEERAEVIRQLEALRSELRKQYPSEYQARYGSHRARRQAAQRPPSPNR
jgi:hypothetical protein